MNHGTHLLIICHRLQSSAAEPASGGGDACGRMLLEGGGRIASGRPAEGSGRHGAMQQQP
eukprot:scaffold4868_cov83-Skeletonema_menzelii.AAC.2